MTWFKRYAIGSLVWLVLGGIHEGYGRPGQETRWGASVVVAAVWPGVTAVIAGSAIGEAAYAMSQDKQG